MANEKRTTKRGRKRMEMVKKIAKNIGVIVLAIAVLFVASLVAGLCATPFEHAPYVGLIVQCLVAIVATLALAWLVSTKILKMDAEELGIVPKRFQIKWLLLAIALPVVVLLFYAFVLPGKPYVAQPGKFWESFLVGFFGAGLMAGITEEVVFRGIIFRYMKKTLGVKVAVIVPAILFACLHIMNMETFDVLDLVILILAGSSVAIMFTLYALNTDMIYPGAIAHCLWNTLIIGGTFGVGEIVNGSANDSYIIIPIVSESKLLTGGNFGVEAAVPAIVGYIVVAVIGYMSYKKRKAE